MNKKRIKRKQAFIGSIIGGVANAVGSIVSSKKENDAKEKLFQEQQTAQNRKEAYQQAANLTSAYSNQNYVDDYKSRITLKNGGHMKNNKSNKDEFYDRIKLNKKYSCGGRKKKFLGSSQGGDVLGIGQAIGGIGNMVGQFMKNNEQKTVKENLGYDYTTKTGLENRDYNLNNNMNNNLNNNFMSNNFNNENNNTNNVNNNVNNNSNNNTNMYQDRLQYEMKCGGKRKKKCGGKAR